MAKKASNIAREARKCCEKWRAVWKLNIHQYHDEHAFILGDQWTDEESRMLKNYSKIPLMFNKQATLINALVGEQQQNTPQIQVIPMDNCDEKVAHIRELIVKDIMFSGDAKTTYQVVASQTFIGGFSAYAVLSDYRHSKSFDQDIYYRYFKDPTKCYWDVGAEDVNKTDGMYCGWLTRVSREKLRDMYGKNIEAKILPDSNRNNRNDIAATREEVALVSDPGTEGDQFIWADDESVTIQHHFKRITKSETLYKLSNGRTCNQDDLDVIIARSKEIQEQKMQEQQMQMMMQMQQMQQQPQAPTQAISTMQDPNLAPGSYDPLQGQQAPQQPNTTPQFPTPQNSISQQNPQDDRLTLYDGDDVVRIEDEKESDTHEFKYYKLCGEYILDETTFQSDECPLIFVDQNSYYDKNGKQVCRPFLIDAKDAQRYINYLGTQSAYVLKVSRYDQWIGSKKNVASNDTQQKWSDPLVVQGMLTFDESPSGIVPQRMEPPELSASLLTQYQRAIEDMYTSTGLYPSRLGQQGNEVSGKAIDARTQQGNYATYIAYNSINRAIAKGGEIVNQLIPYIYDATRVISLMDPEEGMKTITINQQMDEYGEVIENDIRKGTYQVRLIPGPSFEGQKEEALNSLNAAIQAAPQVFPLVADLYAENLPLANTIELKNRLKTLVPPQIIEAGKSGKMPPQQSQQDPQAMQMQMQQQEMQMNMQIKQQELQLKAQQLQLNQMELQLKAKQQDSDVQIEMAKLQAEQQQIEGEIERQKMEFMADIDRTNMEAHMGHSNNIAKILTHKAF